MFNEYYQYYKQLRKLYIIQYAIFLRPIDCSYADRHHKYHLSVILFFFVEEKGENDDMGFDN